MVSEAEHIYHCGCPPDFVETSRCVLWNPGLNTEPLASFAENGCGGVCLGVGLGMLAGTSGCQPRACWEERTVAGYMRFEKDSGASRPAPLQGGRRKGTTVCWSLPFLCQNISTKKIQRNGIPSPHTCFFFVWQWFGTNNQGARIWNLNWNCPHAAWFAPSICHPAGFCAAVVTQSGAKVLQKLGGGEAAAVAGGAVAPALRSLALWFLCWSRAIRVSDSLSMAGGSAPTGSALV
jgi:hypothetical protein